MKEIADYCEKIKQEFDSRLKWAREGNDRYLELVTDIDKHKKMLDDEISTKLAEYDLRLARFQTEAIEREELVLKLNSDVTHISGINDLAEVQRQSLFETVTDQNKKIAVMEEEKVGQPEFT